MTLEESVCQYTNMYSATYLVPDITNDEQFNDKTYVQGKLVLKYCFSAKQIIGITVL